MPREPYRIMPMLENDGPDKYIFVEVRFDNGGYWCAPAPEIIKLAEDLLKAARKAYDLEIKHFWK